MSLALLDNSSLIFDLVASDPDFSSIVFNTTANVKALLDGDQTVLRHQCLFLFNDIEIDGSGLGSSV